MALPGLVSHWRSESRSHQACVPVWVTRWYMPRNTIRIVCQGIVFQVLYNPPVYALCTVMVIGADLASLSIFGFFLDI